MQRFAGVPLSGVVVREQVRKRPRQRWLNLYANDERENALDLIGFFENDLAADTLGDLCSVCYEALRDPSPYRPIFTLFGDEVPAWPAYAAYFRRRVVDANEPLRDTPINVCDRGNAFDANHTDCLLVNAFETFLAENLRLRVCFTEQSETRETLRFDALEPPTMFWALLAAKRSAPGEREQADNVNNTVRTYMDRLNEMETIRGNERWVVLARTIVRSNIAQALDGTNEPAGMPASFYEARRFVAERLVDDVGQPLGPFDRTEIESFTDVHRAVMDKDLPALRGSNLDRDVNAGSTRGNTPLHVAVAVNAPREIAELLMYAGARVNIRNRAGKKPLEYSTNGNVGSAEAVSLASEYAKVVGKENVGGNQAAFIQAWIGRPNLFARFDRNSLIDLLYDDDDEGREALLGVFCTWQNTLLPLGLDRSFVRNLENVRETLWLAAFESMVGQHAVVFECIIGRMPLDELNRIRRATSLLHYAAHELTRDTEMLDALLRRNANPNLRLRSGATPLHEAASYFDNHEEVVAKLVAAGAKIDVYDALGNTPYHYACSAWLHDQARFLLQSDGLDFATRMQMRNSKGFTPFRMIFQSDRRTNIISLSETIEFFIENRSMFDIDTVDNVGMTPLMATIAEKPWLAVICLALGSQADKKTFNGENAYHVAARPPDPFSRLTLLNIFAGDNIERNNDGQTYRDLLGDRRHSFDAQISKIDWRLFDYRRPRGQQALLTAVALGYVDSVRVLIDLGFEFFNFGGDWLELAGENADMQDLIPSSFR